MTVLLTALTLAGPALGAGLDGTLKKIKSTDTITLGQRESLVPRVPPVPPRDRGLARASDWPSATYDRPGLRPGWEG